MENYLTYKEISDRHNISVESLKKKACNLKIKGKNLSFGSTKHFSKSQVEILIEKKKSPNLKFHQRNIDIIELFNKGIGIKRICGFLGCSETIGFFVAKEYQKTGFVIVESKLNHLY